MIKVCVVMGYGSNEDGEERESFCNEMNRTLDNVGNVYRLCILRDLNRWIGDRTRAGITLVLLEFLERMIIVEEWWSSAERGLCVDNIF